MDHLFGLLRICVKRGINLAVRDVRTSDPYVVIKMAKQKWWQPESTISERLSGESPKERKFVRAWEVRCVQYYTDGMDVPYGHEQSYSYKLKTRVIRKDVNPEWNEDLTLSVSDPNLPILLIVYDHDTFSADDRMGDAEFDIRPFIEAVKMKLEGLPNNTIITKVQSSRTNCLSEESHVVWKDGKVVHEMCLRLRNVECGEVEIELQWIDVPGSRGL